MTLSEILPTIRSLPRADKLRLIQLLAADVARDDGIVLDIADKSVPIWSPHDSLQGAATLLRFLDEDFDVCFFRSQSVFEIQRRG